MPKKMDKLDKRGVDLTLNTIIIAVLVILVLVVVVVFFLGGFQGLTSKIRNTFFSSTAGTDRVFAVQTCEQFCEQAKLLPPSSRHLSAYCNQAFVLDGESKKEGDQYTTVFTCDNANTRVSETSPLRAMGISGLRVGCPEINCKP